MRTRDDSPRALQLREWRELNREVHSDYKWASYREGHDIFDLRYLFDDEEVIQDKLERIEYFGRNFFEYHDDDIEDEEYEESQLQPLMRQDSPESEEENWDDYDDNVRFDYRLGFIYDDYDSGYDEPNSRREPYPPFDNEEEPTDEEEEIRQRLANLLVEMHLRRARVHS